MHFIEKLLGVGLVAAILAVGLGSFCGSGSALAADGTARRPQTDPPEPDTPGPVRFMLEVEVLDPDGAHLLLDAGIFDTEAQAVTEVERITREGVCVPPPDPGDPGLAATCYPPSRHLRTRLLKVWF